MSAPIVQGNYDILEDIISRFEDQADEVSTMIRTLTSVIDPLQGGGWAGDAAKAFYREMEEELFPTLSSLEEAFVSGGQFTQYVINRMQAAEEEAAGQFDLFEGGGLSAGGAGNAFGVATPRPYPYMPWMGGGVGQQPFGPNFNEFYGTPWGGGYGGYPTNIMLSSMGANANNFNLIDGWREEATNPFSPIKVWSPVPGLTAVRKSGINPFIDNIGFAPTNPNAPWSPAQHALGEHEFRNPRGSRYTSASMLPEGAPRFEGKRYWIDIDKAEQLGSRFINERELMDDMDRVVREGIDPSYPSRASKWRNAQPIFEREVLFDGRVDPRAIDTRAMRYMRYGGRVVQVGGAAMTVYDMGSAAKESFDVNSPAPIAAETVRQVGGWAGAVAGAKLGGAAGGAIGLTTGPGAILTGLGGAVIGGAAGYFGADWLADHIYEN